MTTQRWNIDAAHSGIQFSVRHMVIAKVRGGFTRWEGTLDFDPKEPAAARVSVRIDAASIDTREAKRDEHLRSADFFNVAEHPKLTFESRKIEPLGGNNYRLVGDISIRGITREIALEGTYLGTAKDPWGNQRVSFEARTSLNRKDFGLTWNQALEAGGVLVGDQVEIAIDLEAVQAQSVSQAA